MDALTEMRSLCSDSTIFAVLGLLLARTLQAGPVTAGWIAHATGKSERAIRQALTRIEHHYAERVHYRGWRLLESAHTRLPLWTPTQLPIQKLSTGVVDNSDYCKAEAAAGAASAPSSSSKDSFILDQESVHNSESIPLLATTTAEAAADSASALRTYGVTDRYIPTLLSTLAANERAASYVLAHGRRIRKEHGANQPRLLAWRIRHNEPAPTPANTDDRSRYLDYLDQ